MTLRGSGKTNLLSVSSAGTKASASAVSLGGGPFDACAGSTRPRTRFGAAPGAMQPSSVIRNIASSEGFMGSGDKHKQQFSCSLPSLLFKLQPSVVLQLMAKPASSVCGRTVASHSCTPRPSWTRRSDGQGRSPLRTSQLPWLGPRGKWWGDTARTLPGCEVGLHSTSSTSAGRPDAVRSTSFASALSWFCETSSSCSLLARPRQALSAPPPSSVMRLSRRTTASSAESGRASASAMAPSSPIKLEARFRRSRPG
mmetsp:Transcript_136938/g.381760  ORF Transcript_136938/g.381760 Transcript_136938/m.381760 type:complete len:255 (+) Transcript_136938:125-889(+)